MSSITHRNKWQSVSAKKRSTVTNYMRLLKLPPDIQLAVRSGVISMGHARALINIDEVEKQLFVFNEIKSKNST